MQQRPPIRWSVALAALIVLVAGVRSAGSTSSCDPETQVACRNHPHICVDFERLQDGTADCPDASDEDCQPWEFTCSCGQPRCVSASLISNGVLDCADGSDEGLIGGNCKSSEDLQDIDDLVRLRRATAVRVEVNAGQTTTFFLATDLPVRSRPLGFITSTKGAFINEGTTTEYTTQIVGTSIEGTYAKIQNTKSRVYSVIPTESFGDLPQDQYPVGLFSSSLVTRIRGETTTVETTQFIRTFIDESYAQEILTTSEIFAPIRDDTDSRPVAPSPVSFQIIPTAVLDGSLMDHEDPGKIVFQTAHLTSLVGERVIESSIAGVVQGSSSSEEDTKAGDDDDKKIISAFVETLAPAADPSVAPAKPVVALETIVAGAPVVDTEKDDSNEAFLEADEEATTEVATNDEPVEITEDKPISVLLQEIGETVAAAAEPDQESSTETETETATDISVPKQSLDENEGSNREPRVELGAPISLGPARPLGATLRVRPAAPAVQPTGLISSFEGSLVADGTTTVYTSLVFGTVIDGEWANVVSTITSVILPSAALTVLPSAPVAILATPLADEAPVSDERPAQPELEGSLIEPSVPVTETPTGMLPVTRLTTFTFFTTFFETREDTVVTSISTREVVSSEVQFVEETAKPSDLLDEMMALDKDMSPGDVVTQFTTFTYFSTLFDEETTRTFSRTEVVSNVLTVPVVEPTPTAPEASEAPKMDDKMPASVESSLSDLTTKRKNLFNSLAQGIVKTFFTTFTFFTTALVNGTTVVSSRIVVSSNAVTPTVQLTDIDEELWESLKAQDEARSRSKVSTVVVAPTSVETEPIVASTVTSPAPEVEPEVLTTSPETIEDTTEKIADVFATPEAPQVAPVDVQTTPDVVTSEKPVTEEPQVVSEVPVVAAELPIIVPVEELPDATESPVTESDTLAPEIDPSVVTDEPAWPQTFFTTFTYFTTYFTGEVTNIVSREETITNLVTAADELVEATVPPLPSVFPITYYTTYTYRTTSVSDGETIVNTREETVSNVVTPTAGELSITPSEIAPIEITPTVDPGLTTFFTTFTYFTTSFEGDTAIITSSLETITNIVSDSQTIVPTATAAPALDAETVPTIESSSEANNGRTIGNAGTSQLILDLSEDPKQHTGPTGLLSTIRSTKVNSGVTTVFTTDVLGTIINGQYARILESSSEVLNPRPPTTVIVAAAAVEGVEATDIFPGATQSTELEGSIVQASPSSVDVDGSTPSSAVPAGESEGSDGDDEGSKTDGKGGRITTRLVAPPRSRTFTPSIRPFTQRPRPPLPTRPRRPPFTNNAAGGEAEEPVVVASNVAPASSAPSSSTTRSFSSRFRPSGASSPSPVVSSTAVEGSRGLFRSRVSSLLSITPTPVLSSGSTSRRFSSLVSPVVSSARSSLSGLPVRRPGTLSSSLPVVRTSVPSSTGFRPATSSTNRFSRPSVLVPPVADDGVTTESANVETSTSTAQTAATVASVRRPFTPRPRPTSDVQESTTATTTTSAPSTPSGRRFPFSRASARPTVTESTRNAINIAEDDISGTTPKPRFVRPPKLTFTEKPRPAVRLPTRPNNRNNAEAAASNIEPVVVEAPNRSKRQTNFDYYYYDPLHYRRPSRGSGRRTGRTRSGSNRAIEVDYDYDQQSFEFDYDASEDERVTTRPRTSSSSSSALRDRLNANSKNRQTVTTRPRTRTSTSSSTSRNNGVGRNRKPVPEEVSSKRFSPSSSRTRTDSASRSRSKTSSQSTSEKPPRRFGNSRRPSTRNRVTGDFREELDEQFINPTAPKLSIETAPTLSVPLSVTHRIPVETTIPVVNNGVTDFKTVLAAKPSVEVLQQYTTSKVSGTWRYLASEISATPTPGVTVVTQFVLKPTETQTVTFTPTTIRGRPTSFSHLVPSTAFEVETVVSTMTDPVASTNNLLQQLLLSGLQQTPVTSFVTHTSTFVTTLTEFRSTKLPITLRGIEIFTTIVGTSTSVITATEFSTQTIVTGPTESPAGNPLASLLPALLGNQLLQAQLLAPQLQPQQPSPVLPIQATQAPQLTVTQQPIVEEEEIIEEEPVAVSIAPAKPIATTSVVTLFVSGRRPGEFSSIVSTITLDGGDATVVKRQVDATATLPLEPSELPFMVGTDDGLYELPEHYAPKDLDFYIVSAISDISVDGIVSVGQTQHLKSEYIRKLKKADSHKLRKLRSVTEEDEQHEEVEIEELEEPLESVESQIDEVRVEPLPSGARGTLRRKVVTVTRKLSVASGERTAFFDDDFVSNNRARKVVVVARRRPSASDAVNDVPRHEDETDAAHFAEKKTKSKVTEAPSLSSSLIDTETEAPHRSGLFGDAFAPRTYLTVYSYFYTLLNGPNSGSVSSREVSISEIVRGSDARIPQGFQRTENANGIYPLSTGRSIADLSTRVNSGITTQVNLASMTFVKYGRGTVRATVPVPKKEELVKPVSSVVRPAQPRQRTTIVPTPRLEPSFEALTAESEEETIAPTKRLQTVRRTSVHRGRAIDVSQVVKKPVSVEEPPVTKKAVTGANRGRGTVRFNAASVLGEQFEGTTPALNRGRQKTSTVVRQQRPSVQPTVVRRPHTSVVRSRPQPVRLDINENIDVEEEESEDFHDDADLDEHVDDEYYDDHHEGGDEHDEDYDHDDIGDENDVNEPTTPASPSSVTSSAATASTTQPPAKSTKPIGVTPTRTTISRKNLNPLQSHLSSILANSRSSLKSSSTVQTSNDPSSSNFFRSRLSSKTTLVPAAFQTSTVVYKHFQTLSTLPVDGGRSGIALTLITSTLTTLFDDEIALITQSPDVFKPVIQPTPLPAMRPKQHVLNPTARLSLPIRASVAIGNTLLNTVPAVESTIEDTATEVNTETLPIELLPSIGEPTTLTVVETQFKTFTAIVTRKSDQDEEVVTTRLEVLPELVTRTVVQPTPVVDVQGSIDTEIAPTPRAIPARDGREQILFTDEEEERGARLNIGSGRPQNFATKVMRNGVEVLVASDKKPTLLAQNVIQKSQFVIEPSPPITLAASTLTNQVTLASEIDNIRLLSSIQSDPARFQTMTQMTTFTYLTTFVDGASKVVSSREEVITNLVTQEIGRPAVQPTATVTRLSGEPGSYDILTQSTTFTYYNTFMDRKRPVVLTSKETVANVVTVPAGQSEPVERTFDTSTYLRTYVFSSKLDRDAIATSKEVVTQIVVTEAPRIVVRPTPVVTFTEVTKTYLNTVTFLTTEVEGTDAVVRKVTSIKPEIVVETISDIEPTPVLEGSQIMPTEDEFEADVPLVATKTYFTTMTHFTTLQQGTKTVVQSHKEVKSSVVTETIAAGSLSASLFAEQPVVTKVAQDVRPTYFKLGPNLYGKLRTLFATATYFITNSVGEVTSKRLVVPQVTTETVPLSIIPNGAVIEPSLPTLPDIETTPVPTSSQILSPAQLQALKESFVAGQQSTTATNKPSILSPDQLSSLKESFLASKPSGEFTDIDVDGGLIVPGDESDTSTDPSIGGNFDVDVNGGADFPDPTGSTVLMVTNQAGEVLIVPTEILGVQASTSSTPPSSSSSSGSGISGGTLASIIGGLGTLGLTALGQSLVGNNPSGLNINLGPVFDAMTGVLSNGLIAAASRRNSTDRSDSADPNDFPLNQHLNTPPFQPNPPPRPTVEPLFIPIGGLAGATESSPVREPQARRPAPQTFIPLKPAPGFAGQQQRPQSAPVRRPEQAIPLQPGVPGSPLLRPGAPIAPQPVPGQQLTPPTPGRPISFSVPPLQTGFTGLPPPPQAASRLPNSPVVQGVRPPPPPFVNGQNNIDRVQIDPSRPVPPGVRPAGNQFFAANGQPINAPPLPGIVPPPANPPPPPNVFAPQPPVNIIQAGAIVPGPDGKPVRIVPVPEGQEPPPGAGGQVFIRPVAVPTQQNRPVFPGQPVNQPPVGSGNVRFPDQPPRRQDANVPFTGFQGSGVQMIASVVGENSIVATNIVSGDKTIVVHPNDPTPILAPPSVIPRPVPAVGIVPTPVREPAFAATEFAEAGGAIEGVGSILTPGLAPASTSTTSTSTTSEGTTSPVTPSHEFAFGSESGEADHTPILNIFSDSPSTEILPSVFEVITETEASPTTSPRRPTEPQEPFGVTSVVMGPDREDFTTIVSRVEFDGRTALSTIINQATTVSYVEPTTVPTTTTSTSSFSTPVESEEAKPEPNDQEDVNTFPSDSIFVPPTKEPIQIPSTTRRPSTAAAPIEPPVAQDVMDNNKDNKAVFGNFGGAFGVNQPSTFTDGCRGRCRKDKLEVCVYANGQHDCLCRPGHSRSNPFEACTKTFTYQLQLVLQQYNNTMLHYDNALKDEISPQYRSLVSSARLGLKQALMRTDLSDEVQESHVMAIHPASESEVLADGVLVDFFVHLKKEQDEDELKNKLVQSLEGNNYLLGDSDIVAARFSDSLVAQDFDECSHEGHHDCSDNSDCINVRGTYQCQCKSGFVSDFDENGHKCIEERQDCERCNNHGRCVFEPETNVHSCICNKWFTGAECQINLKVVMIAVLAVGIFLILLITAIIVVCCLRSRRAKGSISGGPSFLRYRGPSVPTTGTLDRSAIIRGDTSSEGSGNETLAAGSSTLDGKPRAGNTATGPALQSYRPYGETLMIPRAKHQHGPSTATSPAAAERGEASVQREHQLMDYLDGRGPKKVLPDRDGKMLASTEALSATGRTSVSSTSQFRDSLEKEESAEPGNTDKPAEDTTVSEVRSFDETTIHPATRRPAQYYQSDESENSNFDSL